MDRHFAEAVGMRLEQQHWEAGAGWSGAATMGAAADLVLVFGDPGALEDRRALAELRGWYPKAHFVGCSTAGEIEGTRVADGTLVATAIHFDQARLRVVRTDVGSRDGSNAAGQRLGRALDPKHLRHVFVLSDGQVVNGSALVEGLQAVLPPHVAVTGGLAGDGSRFERTLVLADDAPAERQVIAIGFYGERLRVGYGSLGGWDAFGPMRLVTKSRGNVLYELDGQPALALYKKYLGEHAAGLPATGLLFPLNVQVPGSDHEVVRTILNVDEADQSLVFAGDVPEGANARLMKANFDRLVEGAQGAAQTSAAGLGGSNPELAILISCVGRKLVLKQRTEQELEAVRDILGPRPVLAGFYSYGEICPAAPNANCELHNQTMTITTFAET